MAQLLSHSAAKHEFACSASGHGGGNVMCTECENARRTWPNIPQVVKIIPENFSEQCLVNFISYIADNTMNAVETSLTAFIRDQKIMRRI